MNQICFRKGNYKYELMHDWSYATSVRPGGDVAVDGGWVALQVDGTIRFKARYLWDGPSGPALDTTSFMRGALVHDGLYQLLRAGQLGQPESRDWHRYRKLADKALAQICKVDGMGWLRRAWVYRALRWFGAPAAKPGDAGRVRCAPDGCDVSKCVDA